MTFSTRLIQGPTPFGFETKDSSAQGGDSFLTEKTEEIESKASNEETRTELSKDELLFAKEERHKDGDLLAYVLAAPEKLDTEEPKAYEEDWKKAGTEENVDMERGNEAEGKVSKILEDGIFGDRVKENATLSKVHTSKQDELQCKAVPGQKLQVELRELPVSIDARQKFQLKVE
ncbi:hypothetical protein DY000_02042718 [Brassica cretica]|uniref:S1 motif domain-containing protein n=1 Tax=Brassica cretica TaxID=69181 RepID=A0ABQ7BCD7_BRACR|nr:hypothetical protein DY000_02042718 [Brassica cretica]